MAPAKSHSPSVAYEFLLPPSTSIGFTARYIYNHEQHVLFWSLCSTQITVDTSSNGTSVFLLTIGAGRTMVRFNYSSYESSSAVIQKWVLWRCLWSMVVLLAAVFILLCNNNCRLQKISFLCCFTICIQKYDCILKLILTTVPVLCVWKTVFVVVAAVNSKCYYKFCIELLTIWIIIVVQSPWCCEP